MRSASVFLEYMVEDRRSPLYSLLVASRLNKSLSIFNWIGQIQLYTLTSKIDW